MRVGVAPVELRPGFIVDAGGAVFTVGFRRQFGAVKGVACAVHRGGGRLCHMTVHVGAAAVRAGEGGKNHVHAGFQRWRARRVRYQRRFNARAVRLGDDHGRHALGVGRTVIFRGGGGQFGVADAHRRGIVYHALAVLRVAAGNHERDIARRLAVTAFGRYRQHDAFARFDLRGVERLIQMIGGERYRVAHGGRDIHGKLLIKHFDRRVIRHAGAGKQPQRRYGG